MCQLNKIGADVADIDGVTAMTDVTGFALMGHLIEMCEGSGVKANINFDAIPFLEPVKEYLEIGCVPGGTLRNFDSYGDKLAPMSEEQRNLLCDPQTSGGLLIAVKPESEIELAELLTREGLYAQPIGELIAQSKVIKSNADYLVEVI